MNEGEDFPVFPSNDEYLNTRRFSDSSMQSWDAEMFRSPSPERIRRDILKAKKAEENALKSKKKLDPVDKYLDKVMAELNEQTEYLYGDKRGTNLDPLDLDGESDIEENNSDKNNNDGNNIFIFKICFVKIYKSYKISYYITNPL